MTAIRPAYARVRRLAADLTTGTNAPPINLDQIAENLGAKVRLFDLALDISGMLYREVDRRVIVVNQNHPIVRQRFTIAHEIGHLVLHQSHAIHVDERFKVNFRDPRSATADDVEEIEANAFAADLLMPATWIRRDVETRDLDPGDDHDLAALAARYGVSQHSMALRLATLFR